MHTLTRAIAPLAAVMALALAPVVAAAQTPANPPAQASSAAPLVQPIRIGEKLAKTIADDYGAREAEVLTGLVDKAVRAELDRRGVAAPLTIAITLIDAKPNRPTFEQLSDRPGLDYFGSVSIGGAALEAQILAADGRVVRELGYRWFENDIRNAVARDTWGDARRAIRRFAHELGDAYAEAAAPPAS